MTDTTQTPDPANSADPTPTPSSTPAETAAEAAAAKAAKGADKAAGGDKGTTKGQQLQDEEAAAWYAGLPDDLKSQGHVTRHASVEDAVRALIGAEKRLGVPADQLVRLPTKPEESADLYRKLGAPETADGYKIGLPDGATDEDKATAKSFAEHMHKAGPFPPDFVKAALDWNNAQTEAGNKALAAAEAERRTAGETFLKNELKAGYDPEMKAVGKLLNDLGGPELRAELDLSGHGDNPRLMLALHKMVEKLGEPQTIDGGNRGSGVPGQLTAGQARAAREILENDPVRGPALTDKSHAMHGSVMAERKRLLRIENGQDPDGE